MNDRTFDTSGYGQLQDHIRDIVIEPGLEVIENKYFDRNYLVELTADEFISVCPKTGLPDFAVIKISYIPDKHLVEEKSLKLYLTAYMNLGIFQEHAANKIHDDFIAAVKPRQLKISANWKSRGGITANIEVSSPK